MSRDEQAALDPLILLEQRILLQEFHRASHRQATHHNADITRSIEQICMLCRACCFVSKIIDDSFGHIRLSIAWFCQWMYDWLEESSLVQPSPSSLVLSVFCCLSYTGATFKSSLFTLCQSELLLTPSATRTSHNNHHIRHWFSFVRKSWVSSCRHPPYL